MDFYHGTTGVCWFTQNTVVTEKRNFGNMEHTLLTNVNHNYLMK